MSRVVPPPVPRPASLAPLVAAALLTATAAQALEPGSELVGCEQADTRVVLSASAHLDPSCVWTRGVEIVASGVTLDCQGARIAAPDRRYGILVTAPADVALSNVTVRNCEVEGFLNDLRITREGFQDLAEGAEYEHAFSNILVEDSAFLGSRGVGVFVDGYVTGVTIRRSTIAGSGSAGIYLEAGSKDNVVEDNLILHNGYVENGPDGQLFELGGLFVWFWGTGREGLAIDGSRSNLVRGNFLSGNAAGGIFLYKNCGEFVNERPERWWPRRYGADGNLIERNTFFGERIGVWIASRMGENTAPMDCSDPPYLPGVVLDYARDNTLRENVLRDVTFGVRVEDDGAVVEDNEFSGDDPAQQAIVVGTRSRTEALGAPVDGTAITGNRASLAGVRNPYRWIHGHENTTFVGNESAGRVVGLCEGVPPPMGPWVFVVAYEVVVDPESPPTGPPPEPPPLEPLPPCPLACAAAATAETPRLRISRLHTEPGDDRLSFRGRVLLAAPFAPPLDPVATGVGIAIEDAAGGRVLDVAVPGGAFDPVTRTGWKVDAKGGRFTYVDESASPQAGIGRVAIEDRSHEVPGLVEFRVKGRRGTYPVDPALLPLTALLVLDPPTAETGQCAAASFPGPTGRCRATQKAISCR